MRRLMIIIAAALFTGAAQAQFRPATLTMTDGSVREGFVETPGPEKNNVDFKAAESDRKAEKLKSRDVRTIPFADGAEPREMEYLNRLMKEGIVSPAGWGWLKVVSRGAVSVYMGAKPRVAGQTYANNEDIMYIHREGDRYATWPPILTFAAAMSKYFEDYPDLSAKIRDKAAGYQRENIDAIVAEYNAWKGRQ